MIEGKRAAETLRIGDLVLDVGQRRVTRDGVPLDLPKLSFRLLHELAMAAPNVLTQDELMQRVWPGRVISPETLTQRVKLLRQAIDDDARHPRYIGLARGEGYRLLVAVEPLSDSEQRPAGLFLRTIVRSNVLPLAAVYVTAAWALSAALPALAANLPILPSWSPMLVTLALVTGFPVVLGLAWHRTQSDYPGPRWSESLEGRMVATAALLALVASTAGLSALIYPTAPTASNNVAVLPFENLSGPADEFLREGISGQLRDQLGNISDLRVVARGSSVIFRDGDSPLTTIAEQLAARNLVVGSIQRFDDLLRISVEIVDGATGARIWGEQYTTQRDGLLAVRQQIFTDVAASLLPHRDPEAIATALPTQSESAYSLMLMANNYYQDVVDEPVIDSEMLEKAIATYGLAVDEDPSSPLLHSRLASALLYAGQLDTAEISIRRAITLDNEQKSSHLQHTLGLYLQARHEDGVGERHARAVELNGNNVEALASYGLYLWTHADIPGARSHLERALEVDPRSIVRYEQLGNFYGTSGFHEAAIALAERIRRNFDVAEASLTIARIYELTGDLDEAVAWVMRAHEQNPVLESVDWKLGELYARMDVPEAAQHYDPGPSISKLYFSRDYEDMIDLIADRGGYDGYTSQMIFALATAYAATDRSEQAVRLLTHYGLPSYLQRDSATTSEIEAGITLADALNQTGRHDEALQVAKPLIELFRKFAEGHPESWHPYINLACLLSIAGDEEQALRMLERMAEKRGLPWYPRVKDQPCFRTAFGDSPRYQAVLDSILQRKKQLRVRLAGTLERFGLADKAYAWRDSPVRTTSSH